MSSAKEQVFQDEKKYMCYTYNRAPFILEHGEGVYLFDSEGNRYIDCLSGIAVNALGYGHEGIVKALTDQASKLIHCSNLYVTTPQVTLAKTLVESSFADKVFFSNSGTESVEGCIKFARKYAKERFPENKNKYKLVAFQGSFHGRSMGALSVTATSKYQKPFEPLIPGVSFCEFNNLEMARELIDEDVCAVIVEPVQGEGGVNVAEKSFLQGLREACDKAGALLIFDEVQVGLGRSGKLYGHENFGVTPDLMSLAKPLGGGFPLGAILCTDEAASFVQPGDHASTFGGNPAICAVAQVVLDEILEEGFLATVQEVGDYLRSELIRLAEDFPVIKEVRGLGQLTGVVVDGKAGDYIQGGYRNGLILGSAGDNVLRFAPPLTMTKEEVDQVIKQLKLIFEDVAK